MAGRNSEGPASGIRVPRFHFPRRSRIRNVRNEIHLALHLNKDFLAVYLTDTQLPPGLQLSISSIQAILKYRMSPQSYRRKIAKALSDTLRESVNDDQLAWATFYSSDLNFEDDDLFYRAFVVRLEAFADLQDFSGAESGKTLSVGGMKVSFRVEQGKFKQITFEAQDWKEVSSQTRTAMLVYWEEYLSGLSLQALKKTKSAALVDRVLERTVRRWADLGLLEPVLNSRTDGLNDRWQQMTIPVVQVLVENPGAPISKLLFEQIVTKKTVPGFNYPETETEWFAWQQAVIKAGQESLQRVADSFDMNSNKAKQSLVNADVPEFLLRHIRRKILAKDSFIMNFKDSLKGRPLEWARALLLEGRMISVGTTGLPGILKKFSLHDMFILACRHRSPPGRRPFVIRAVLLPARPQPPRPGFRPGGLGWIRGCRRRGRSCRAGGGGRGDCGG
ncbi:MAG: hypothetical protein U1F77_06680 [Kiritimatiellia bacterium]